MYLVYEQMIIIIVIMIISNNLRPNGIPLFITPIMQFVSPVGSLLRQMTSCSVTSRYEEVSRNKDQLDVLDEEI